MADIQLTEKADTYVQPEADKYAWNTVYGLAGDDVIRMYQGQAAGGPGNDTIERITEGASSWSTLAAIYYDNAPTGVRADLTEGWAEDGLGGRDTLVGVDGVNTSGKADWLRGNSRDNFFWVGGGDDTVLGEAGEDGVGLSWFSPGNGQPWRQAVFDDLAVTISADGRFATIRPKSGSGLSLTLTDVEYIAYWSAAENLMYRKSLSDYISQETLATQAIAAGDAYRWNAGSALGTATALTYAFTATPPASAQEASGFRAFSVAEQAVVRQVLARTAELTGLSFTEVAAAGADAQLRFGVNQQAATKGQSWLPGTARAGEVWMDVETMADLSPGGEGFAALLHEIGHALGLRHPRNIDPGEAWATQVRAQDDVMTLTAMSQTAPLDGLYRADWGPLDVIALRYLYGTRVARTGDDTYTVGNGAASSKTALVDDGGTDRLDASSAPVGATLRLAPGTLSDAGLTSAGQAAVGNLAIPPGTVIEQAIGSAWDDVIVGNDADNRLQGNAGNDWIDGAAGTDTAVFSGARAAYRISIQYGRVTVEALDGLDGTDTLVNIERLQFADQVQAISPASADDHPGSAATTASLVLGTPANGKLEAPGDTDWFRVTLGAGQAYAFDLVGRADPEGGLGDGDTRARLTLYDEGGNVLQAVIRTVAGDGIALIDFTATAGGTYYLGVDEIFGTGTGAYQVSATQSARGTVHTSGSGDETLVGGSGLDTAVFDGSVTQYTVRIDRSSRTATVTDSQAGRDGQDRLQSIERVEFAGQGFDLFNPPRTEVPQIGKLRAFLFDASYYLLSNPSLATTLTLATAADHYLATGAASGSKPNAWFDAAYYANRWADLKGANLDPATLFMHYNLYGVWEGRSAGPSFDRYDGTRYLKDNPDVAAYVDAYVADFLGSRSNGAIAHYVIYGAAEGRLAYDTTGQLLDATVLVGVAP